MSLISNTDILIIHAVAESIAEIEDAFESHRALEKMVDNGKTHMRQLKYVL
jgi:hypothetical protein